MAKAHLTVISAECRDDLMWDEALFAALIATFLQSSVQPLLASPYESRDEAALVEGQLAQSLVNAYRRIMRQRQEQQVKLLNALL
ncbi:hypothetical protein [Leptothoe sp. PORK10 BA2]|uniref:hypothetical protein n=1 Tax=Leptothoe sp. PORK10 BA2 TaxID=3110254 RepID=UPI002B20983E|nr:hypothetical protein [Leptothoe sp. PORK10 BA2]